MIYNEFSLYRLFNNPYRYLLRLLTSRLRKEYSWNEKDEATRAVNDTNDFGQAAPYTAYSSKKIFETRQDSTWEIRCENIADFVILGKLIQRQKLLRFVKKVGGLDLYAVGIRNFEKK